MKNEELTQARLRELLSYDPETGVFVWLDDRRSGAGYRIVHVKAGDIAGNVNAGDGYRYIGIGAKLFPAHRLAWLYMHGEWPVGEIDHRNGSRDQNMIRNLRDVTRLINAQNRRRARRDSMAGLAGAFKAPKGCRLPWVSSIRTNGKTKYLGQFATAEAAHDAYIEAKRVMHEGCTV